MNNVHMNNDDGDDDDDDDGSFNNNNYFQKFVSRIQHYKFKI